MSRFIDSHTHASMLPYEGLQAMVRSGIVGAVSCAVVISARHAESYLDHFRMITGFYRRLAASVGLELYCAVGVHPLGIPDDWPRVVDSIPEFFGRDGVVAIGEIGINEDSLLERDVLRAQLEMARDLSAPVVVHTPWENRLRIVEKVISIAASVGLQPAKMVIDHAHLDIIGLINDFGAVPGLTIRSQNLTPEVLVENLELFAGGMLNSDYSNIFPNDPVGMIRAVDFMNERKVSLDIIEELAGGKAVRFYGLDAKRFS